MKTFFVLAAAAAFIFSVHAAESGKNLMAQARKLESARQWDKATQVYLKAAAAFTKPQDKYRSTQRAATMLMRQNKNDEAQKLLLDLIKTPGLSKTTIALIYADCCRTTRDNNKKIEFCDAAIALKPGGWVEAAIYNSRAEALGRLKKYAEAEKVYNSVIDNPAYPTMSKQISYMGLVYLSLNQKKFDEVHKICQKVREKKLIFADLLRLEADTYVREKQYDKAVACYMEVISNTKFNKNQRRKCMELAFVVQLNYLKNPAAAKKLVEDCKALNLEPSPRVTKLLQNIK